MTTSFPILDLVIGLIFIFFLLSIICSSLVEIVWSLLSLRARLLTGWLITVFNQRMPAPPPSNAQNPEAQPAGQQSDTTLGKAIINHCMTTVLSGSKRSTSYIHPADFATAFLDLIRNADASQQASPLPMAMSELIPVITASTVLSHEQKRSIASFAQQAADEFHLQRELLEAKQVITDAKTEFALFRKKIEDWYDNNTQRLIGAMKRWSQLATFIIATLFVVLANADTVEIARYLYADKDARDKLVQEAYHATESGDINAIVAHERELARQRNAPAATAVPDSLALSDAISTLQQKSAQIDSAYAMASGSVPLGWKTGQWSGLFHSGAASVVNKILGLIATILAVMLGAPFWFDLLNKVANLRSAGPKPASGADAERKAPAS